MFVRLNMGCKGRLGKGQKKPAPRNRLSFKWVISVVPEVVLQQEEFFFDAL